MNKSIGIQLIAYSLLLAGLSFLTYRLAPTVALPTLVAGLAGGLLSLLWGVRAVAGFRSKAWPLLTLIPICFVMLSQTVMNFGVSEVPVQKYATLLMAILLVISMAMLVRIAYAGVVLGAQPASQVKDGGIQSTKSGKPSTPGSDEAALRDRTASHRQR